MSDDYKANILDLYQRSTSYDRQVGLNWYTCAHAGCEQLAGARGLPVDVVVAIVAVISPRLPWDINIEEARKVIDGETSRALGANVQKASNILRDGDIAHVRGDKVTAFLKNILNPDDGHTVTVDTWTTKIATGDWTKSRAPGKRYEEIAQAFRELAGELGLLPCQLQAIVWVTVKRLVANRAVKGQLCLDI